MLYICDPNKNKDCPKTECFIYGGECRRTTDETFKADGSINKIYDELCKEYGVEFVDKVIDNLCEIGHPNLLSKEEIDLLREEKEKEK